jgi:hypothetical protein
MRLFLALIAALMLSGCIGGSEDTPPTTTVAAQTQTTEAAPTTVSPPTTLQQEPSTTAPTSSTVKAVGVPYIEAKARYERALNYYSICDLASCRRDANASMEAFGAAGYADEYASAKRLLARCAGACERKAELNETLRPRANASEAGDCADKAAMAAKYRELHDRLAAGNSSQQDPAKAAMYLEEAQRLESETRGRC